MRFPPRGEGQPSVQPLHQRAAEVHRLPVDVRGGAMSAEMNNKEKNGVKKVGFTSYSALKINKRQFLDKVYTALNMFLALETLTPIWKGVYSTKKFDFLFRSLSHGISRPTHTLLSRVFALPPARYLEQGQVHPFPPSLTKRRINFH